MNINCLACNKEVTDRKPKYMILPSNIIVKNLYYTCDEHEDKFYNFEDIYNNDGTRKKLY